ncbi:MAG: phosphatidylglycerophosphatase A [Proteobacteria bacterium]|nr:phosphatidylglycerophosphatase A [Pseudomonadota bacterium]
MKFNKYSIISTVGGVGLFPKAPGTAGSFVAVILAWPIAYFLGVYGLAIAVCLVSVLGVWAINHYQAETGSHDASEIVIDEVAGQWLTLSVAPLEPIYFVIGFFAFRLFDIWKPWPVGWVDKNMRDGFGVMADDLLAGVYGILILVLAQRIIA